MPAASGLVHGDNMNSLGAGAGADKVVVPTVADDAINGRDNSWHNLGDVGSRLFASKSDAASVPVGKEVRDSKSSLSPRLAAGTFPGSDAYASAWMSTSHGLYLPTQS